MGDLNSEVKKIWKFFFSTKHYTIIYLHLFWFSFYRPSYFVLSSYMIYMITYLRKFSFTSGLNEWVSAYIPQKRRSKLYEKQIKILVHVLNSKGSFWPKETKWRRPWQKNQEWIFWCQSPPATSPTKWQWYNLQRHNWADRRKVIGCKRLKFPTAKRKRWPKNTAECQAT